MSLRVGEAKLILSENDQRIAKEIVHQAIEQIFNQVDWSYLQQTMTKRIPIKKYFNIMMALRRKENIIDQVLEFLNVEGIQCFVHDDSLVVMTTEEAIKNTAFV